MKLYYSDDNCKLYKGDMLDMLKVIPEGSIDSIVTDPPYGLVSITRRFGNDKSSPSQFGKDGAFTRLSRGFMGKKWDGSGIEYNVEAWKKCYAVLKDGGYLLAFGGSRTYHKIASSIEDAGFEIRDCIMWVYGSGFPKSMSVSKGIEAKEKFNKANSISKRIIEQSCDGEEFKVKQTNNGIMNEIKETTRKHYNPTTPLSKKWIGWGTCLKPAYEPIIVARKPFKGTLINNIISNGVGALNIDECRISNNDHEGSKFTQGRFPSNLILSYDEIDYNEVCGNFPNSSVCRYFYCAKASQKDRNDGLEIKNIHPTVKPTELMQYLVKLVTPKGGTVFDPFMGSGSTGKSVMYENSERNSNYKFIGIEKIEEYLSISVSRIKHVIKQKM